MRYVGRHRAPRPLYLRMPLMVGVAAAVLIGGPALAATTGLLRDEGHGQGLASEPLVSPTVPGTTAPPEVTPSLAAPTNVNPTTNPFTPVRAQFVRTISSTTGTTAPRPSTTTSRTPSVPPTTPTPSPTTTTQSPTTSPSPTPTDTPSPTGSGTPTGPG